jgi:hypothetical protein
MLESAGEMHTRKEGNAGVAGFRETKIILRGVRIRDDMLFLGTFSLLLYMPETRDTSGSFASYIRILHILPFPLTPHPPLLPSQPPSFVQPPPSPRADYSPPASPTHSWY